MPDTPASCGKGYNDQFTKWWSENGRKIRGVDQFDKMPCFDGSKMLDSIIGTIDTMIETIDKHRKINGSDQL